MKNEFKRRFVELCGRIYFKLKVSRLELDVISSLKKISEKYKRVNSTPWCVPINSTQKRPPLTHHSSLKIEEAFNRIKYTNKLKLIFFNICY
jgi:hypothetical protein